MSFQERSEGSINESFDKINELLKNSMIDVHRKPFRSLVMHTIRHLHGRLSFPVSGDRWFLANEIVCEFISAYAERIWPKHYFENINFAGREAERKMNMALKSYVFSILGSDGKESRPIEAPATLLVRLKNYRQREDVVTEHTYGELDDTRSEPDLSLVKHDPCWTKPLRRDMNVETRREKAMKHAREDGMYLRMREQQEKDREDRQSEDNMKRRRGKKDALHTGDQVEWFGMNPSEDGAQDSQAHKDDLDEAEDDVQDAALQCRLCDGASSFPDQWALMAHEEKVHSDLQE